MKTPETAADRIQALAWPKGVTLVTREEPDSLAEAMAGEVADEIRQRLSGAARVSLAVSGGRSPVPFFHALSSKDLGWEAVDITLTDERWVPSDSPHSNARLVSEHLLHNKAARACFHPLQRGSAEEPAEDYDCAALVEILPLDLLVLGMGGDGHTASLFPDAPQLPEALAEDSYRLCLPMHPASLAESPAHTRLTLSYAVLRQASWKALLISGEEKLLTLKQALQEPEDIGAMPIRAFLAPGLRVFWSP